MERVAFPEFTKWREFREVSRAGDEEKIDAVSAIHLPTMSVNLTRPYFHTFEREPAGGSEGFSWSLKIHDENKAQIWKFISKIRFVARKVFFSFFNFGRKNGDVLGTWCSEVLPTLAYNSGQSSCLKVFLACKSEEVELSGSSSCPKRERILLLR